MGWKNATKNRWMNFQEMQTSRNVIESSRLFSQQSEEAS